MSGRTKPPVRRRWNQRAINTMEIAAGNAGTHTRQECAQLLQPAKAALQAIRAGQAAELDWIHLVTVAKIAASIEHQGIVRMFKAKIHAADNTLHQIEQRARKAGPESWAPPTLHGFEIVQLDDLVWLYGVQASKLSASEYRAAWRHAIAENRRLGGREIHQDKGTQNHDRRA
jgi:hypothetical protein